MSGNGTEFHRVAIDASILQHEAPHHGVAHNSNDLKGHVESACNHVQAHFHNQTNQAIEHIKANMVGPNHGAKDVHYNNIRAAYAQKHAEHENLVHLHNGVAGSFNQLSDHLKHYEQYKQNALW